MSPWLLFAALVCLPGLALLWSLGAIAKRADQRGAEALARAAASGAGDDDEQAAAVRGAR